MKYLLQTSYIPGEVRKYELNLKQYLNRMQGSRIPQASVAFLWLGLASSRYSVSLKASRGT
jgi:hypothetical protein